jgi:hypothetical protein
MQFRAVVCSALFAGANAVSAQVEVNARMWLLDHPSNSPDELDELKVENPDAYALVKALLTKRSLGLLDPKHPTASFAAPPPKDSEEQQTGAAVYAKFATTEKEQEALQGATPNVPYPDAPAEQIAVPYPEASEASHDWINWKPHDGATDDEAMVKNVLGTVADLTKGKSLRGTSDTASDETSPVAAEVAAMQAESPITTSPPEVTTTQVATQAAVQDNSYLKGLDLTPAPQVEKPVATEEADKNALESFTWDDSQSTTTTTMAPKVAKGGSNPLASWLGLVKPHVQIAAPPAAEPSNPYLTDLQ